MLRRQMRKMKRRQEGGLHVLHPKRYLDHPSGLADPGLDAGTLHSAQSTRYLALALASTNTGLIAHYTLDSLYFALTWTNKNNTTHYTLDDTDCTVRNGDGSITNQLTKQSRKLQKYKL